MHRNTNFNKVSGYCGTTQDYCADPGSCLLGYGRCDSDATPAGPSTANAVRDLKGPITYTDDIYDCVKSNVVALTYDDGPYKYTSDLLDILKSYGFQATFFITGNNNGKGEIDITEPYPSLIKRMIAEGHQVASHTWSHYSLSNISHELRMSQMVKNEMAFNNIIGMWPTYMRPPYSDCTKESGCWADMQTLGYHRVYFDLDTQDYLNPLPTQIQSSKNIVQLALGVTTTNDYLSIQHDIVQQSVGNFSTYYFDLIKAKGWKGVTVGECLGDTDKSNWYRTLNGSTASSTLSSTASASTSTSKSISTSVSSTAVATTVVSSASSTARASTSTSESISTSVSSTAIATIVVSSASSSFTTSVAPSSIGSSKSTPPPAATPTPPTPPTPPTKPTPPTPPTSCAVKVGGWCGNVTPFNDLRSCQKSSATCYSDSLQCVTAAGWRNVKACSTFTKICEKMTLYCLKCLRHDCSSTAFRY
ncbi:hypothetical protein ACMFMG_004864 [Clarireedia jacksonii]